MRYWLNDYSQDELIDVVLKVASGENDYDQLLNWVLNHQIFVEQCIRFHIYSWLWLVSELFVFYGLIEGAGDFLFVNSFQKKDDIYVERLLEKT